MGTLVVSLNLELSWGAQNDDAIGRADRDRAACDRLQNLFDDLRVPVTWAVVGHLLLDDCNGTHPDHPASDDWFADDPGGTAADDSHRFAPDLVANLRAADVDHEVAIQPFSHAAFDSISREQAVAELDASLRAADRQGLDVDSFVFPRNAIDHREVLADRGLACYRGPTPSRRSSTSTDVIDEALDVVFGSTPPVVRPAIDEHGLVEVPSSFYLFGIDDAYRDAFDRTVGDPIARQVRAGIDDAIRDDAVFHLWLRPDGVADRDDFERLRKILSYAKWQSLHRDLDLVTMGELAAGVLDEATMTGSSTVPSRRVSR